MANTDKDQEEDKANKVGNDLGRAFGVSAEELEDRKKRREELAKKQAKMKLGY
jgi:hypothetical protein